MMKSHEALGGFEAFCVALARELQVPVEKVRSCDRLVDDLELDEFGLAKVLFNVEQWNPSFSLPEQLDVLDMTLQDLHYFFCVMTAGHVE
jgi:hypothetical protein